MSEEPELTKCPNCKTRTLHREGEELVCSECKGRFAAPQGHQAEDKKKKRARLLARHQFYEQNKDEIIRDYRAKGGDEAAKKWKVSWPALYHLLRRWQIIETKTRVSLKGKPTHSGVSKRTKGESVYSRYEFHEKNKDNILKDIETIGRKATERKWRIPTSTMSTLLRRWEPSNGRLPQFPEFSNSWEPQVQVIWFEIYGKLLERKE